MHSDRMMMTNIIYTVLTGKKYKLKGNPTLNGNGIVYLDFREGFRMHRDKLIFDKKTRKLKRVLQFAYYLGVKNYISIYADKSFTKKTEEDSNNALYLIKLKSGLTG